MKSCSLCLKTPQSNTDRGVLFKINYVNVFRFYTVYIEALKKLSFLSITICLKNL